MEISKFCLDLMSKCLQYESHLRISFEDMKIHPFITGNKAGWKFEKPQIESVINEDGIEMLKLNIKIQLKIISNPEREKPMLPSFVKEKEAKSSVEEIKVIQSDPVKNIIPIPKDNEAKPKVEEAKVLQSEPDKITALSPKKDNDVKLIIEETKNILPDPKKDIVPIPKENEEKPKVTPCRRLPRTSRKNWRRKRRRFRAGYA